MLKKLKNILKRVFTISEYFFDLMVINVNKIDQCFYKSIYSLNISPSDELKLPTDYFSIQAQRKYYLQNRKYPKLVFGFKFYEKDTNKFIGFCWISKKGVNNFMVRIRNTDAYISEVYIVPEYRGQGYGKCMLQHIFNILKSDSISTISLIVDHKNTNAIRCYEKLGFVFIKKIKFKRFLRCNIPYHKV